MEMFLIIMIIINTLLLFTIAGSIIKIEKYVLSISVISTANNKKSVADIIKSISKLSDDLDREL